MVRVSNFIVGFLNCISLVLGLTAITIASFFYVHSSTHCQKELSDPLFVSGIVLFIVSLLGLIGSCCRTNAILLIYLIVLFLLIVGLVVFIIFSFLITNEDAAKAVSHKGIKGFRTGDFQNWLKNHFVNGKKWNEIRTCLKDSKVCKIQNNAFETAAHLTLSPIQSSCCKPPSECGFNSQNATFWIAPKTGPAVDDSDCKAWKNQQQTLCFDCNACKAGFVDSIRSQWENLLIANLCALVFLIFTYIVGCRAKRNNSTRDTRKFYR
ncbi:tetraspanin-11 [Citrus sinensis]|nr:tetraspanin-11 [Citrus sinensis]